ncbi:jg21066 [Pararge aegeria aegeria]|uniref:Jg21066 protein n=1 Tax=Pararge aegeria aegeria TaxID=348720 RepID=A0A8S4RUY7_9NEOP|nr:jg21066 [Pararge aegeria aegeria]
MSPAWPDIKHIFAIASTEVVASARANQGLSCKLRCNQGNLILKINVGTDNIVGLRKVYSRTSFDQPNSIDTSQR